MGLVITDFNCIDFHTHVWIVDSFNIGKCKYCPEVKDFQMLIDISRIKSHSIGRYFKNERVMIPWVQRVKRRE